MDVWFYVFFSWLFTVGFMSMVEDDFDEIKWWHIILAMPLSPVLFPMLLGMFVSVGCTSIRAIDRLKKMKDEGFISVVLNKR